MHDLRVGIDLVDGIDRPAGNARLVEQLDPLGPGGVYGYVHQVGVGPVALLRALRGGLVFRPLHQIARLGGIAESGPYLRTGRGDVDMPVGGLEYARWNAGRVIVAGLLGHLAADQPARALEVEHEDLCLQQRGCDVLALLRLLAFEQRDQNAERAKQPRAEIGDRDPDAHRPLPRQAGDRHQPAHALRDLVEARPVGVRTSLPVAGDAGIDELGIDLA